ncbi:hypothetical protein GCM10010211_10560 [Streptomyces albospinus]|uniref:Uncharacterized protein n=1 Tax=Streptomyces albospinus TaxID=285515 RepID=A0ABQ2UQV0_9ACTN|nr:hypothetical protein GCM10010211_10560 [Streptomyces albospinus]
MDDVAPFELFRDRLARVTLDIRLAGGRQRKHSDRRVRSLYGFRGLKVQEITLRGRMRSIVVRARADEELARAAIAPACRPTRPLFFLPRPPRATAKVWPRADGENANNHDAKRV